MYQRTPSVATADAGDVQPALVTIHEFASTAGRSWQALRRYRAEMPRPAGRRRDGSLLWRRQDLLAWLQRRFPRPRDFCGRGRAPAPTRHRPGSPGKIDALAGRAARGESLFAPDDAPAE